MLVPIVILFVTQLFLPGYIIYSVWHGRERSTCMWLLKVLSSAAFLLYIFLVGRWDWLSYYLRYVFPILFVVVSIVSYRRVRSLPVFVESGTARWWKNAGALLTLLLIIGFLAGAIRGSVYTEAPVRLALPFRDGWYYVAQGGNSPLVNYHNSSKSQRYALDFVEISALGRRAQGVYPTALERYTIFGETVHSPCDGTIVAAVNSLPDQIPPVSDREHPAGNHIVIRCAGVNVVLAHLQYSSVTVAAGAAVATGQVLGRVGNSGNTSEPHLHMHAVQAGSDAVLEGDGVPILLEGRFAVRNATFWIDNTMTARTAREVPHRVAGASRPDELTCFLDVVALVTPLPSALSGQTACLRDTGIGYPDAEKPAPPGPLLSEYHWVILGARASRPRHTRAGKMPALPGGDRGRHPPQSEVPSDILKAGPLSQCGLYMTHNSTASEWGREGSFPHMQ